MPTAFEIRQKNAAFNNNVRAGKTATKPSRAELAAKRSPVGMRLIIPAEFMWLISMGGMWALGAVIFVVCGGVLFELARLIFL